MSLTGRMPLLPIPGNYDANAVLPSTTIAVALCPRAVFVVSAAAMGPSYNWSAMTSLINNMSPAGTTNQASGLQLGWMSLMSGGVFNAPANDPNYTYADHIML